MYTLPTHNMPPHIDWYVLTSRPTIGYTSFWPQGTLSLGLEALVHECKQTARRTFREQEPIGQESGHGQDVWVANLGRVAPELTPVSSNDSDMTKTGS